MNCSSLVKWGFKPSVTIMLPDSTSIHVVLVLPLSAIKII